MDNLKEVTLEEQEFGEEECKTEVKNESEEMKEDTCPGVIKLTNTKDIKILTEDFLFSVWEVFTEVGEHQCQQSLQHKRM